MLLFQWQNVPYKCLSCALQEIATVFTDEEQLLIKRRLSV